MPPTCAVSGDTEDTRQWEHCWGQKRDFSRAEGRANLVSVQQTSATGAILMEPQPGHLRVQRAAPSLDLSCLCQGQQQQQRHSLARIHPNNKNTLNGEGTDENPAPSWHPHTARGSASPWAKMNDLRLWDSVGFLSFFLLLGQGLMLKKHNSCSDSGVY